MPQELLGMLLNNIGQNLHGLKETLVLRSRQWAFLFFFPHSTNLTAALSPRSVINGASHLTSDLLTQTAGTATAPLPPSLREPPSPSYWPQVRFYRSRFTGALSPVMWFHWSTSWICHRCVWIDPKSCVQSQENVLGQFLKRWMDQCSNSRSVGLKDKKKEISVVLRRKQSKKSPAHTLFLCLPKCQVLYLVCNLFVKEKIMQNCMSEWNQQWWLFSKSIQ